eukprot:5613730-Amphidinium_carterae.1
MRAQMSSPFLTRYITGSTVFYEVGAKCMATRAFLHRSLCGVSGYWLRTCVLNILHEGSIMLRSGSLCGVKRAAGQRLPAFPSDGAALRCGRLDLLDGIQLAAASHLVNSSVHSKTIQEPQKHMNMNY